MTTDNFRKHTTKNPLQRYFINAFFEILIEELRKLNPDTILDVGCGEGFGLARIHAANIGKELYGIDFLERAIILGMDIHPYLSLRQGDIYNLPYKNDSFDVVLCSEVLEHLEHPQKAIKELQRVSKKHCIITVPNEPIFRIANFLRGKNLSRWGNDIEHIQHWSSGGIVKFVQKYFSIQEKRTPFPWTLVVGRKV